MGLYVNPKDQSKQEWLAHNATARFTSDPRQFDPARHRETALVAYVQNADFDAIAIMFEKVEVLRFAKGRPDVEWWLVPREAVREWWK